MWPIVLTAACWACAALALYPLEEIYYSHRVLCLT